VKHLLLAGVLVLGTGHLAFGAVDWELEVTDLTGDTAIINSSGTLVLAGSASGLAFTNATTGVYTFDGSVGGYLVNVTTGVGSPSLPLGALDLNSIDVAPGGSSGPLTIEWSENGITTLEDAWTMAFGGTLISGSGSTISNTAYQSNTNGFFATTNQIGTIVPTFTGASFSGTSDGSVSGVTAPYSLTEVVTLDGVGPTSYSGDASLTAPEPASLVLLGSVLVAVIAFRRKFMKKAVVD
jgi:PEP-CTERM motif